VFSTPGPRSALGPHYTELIMLTSAQIRQQFIDFFKERGHAFVPSSPVVPYDDPTLMFTNAGMNQFKDVFLGTGRRDYVRAANSQKCIRAGGKHNDLEDVGHDTYHHTFFEMLGNWSFGDYFKAEAILWAWELLTQRWGLEKKRLHATVFAGEPAEGLGRDDESAEMWRRLTDIDPGHVHFFGKKDNFWEMGDTGPCGPCSEIHVDTTPDLSGGPLVNRGDARVMEIWNLVFIQFDRTSSGALAPLPARHVDTGMGLERVSALLQGKRSNYETDLFAPLFAAIGKLTGAPAYTGRLEGPGPRDAQVMIDVAYRVIADHLRCLTFAITDGALLANEGRGYVLRRILRRAVRYGRQFLGVHEPFLHRLVPAVVEAMGAAFPELGRQPGRVQDVLREEEESFGRTFERGVKLFDEAAAQAHTRGGGRISGDAAFKLHDTYGFSIDLTRLMAQEAGLEVDLSQYETLMGEARERARRAAGGADVREVLAELARKEQLPPSLVLGYEMTSTEDVGSLDLFDLAAHGARVAEAAEGSRVALVLDRTPFYAEAGGQVGDTGIIRNDRGEIRVEDTQKVGDVHFHIGQVIRGPFSAAPRRVHVSVDLDRRLRITANHTATHLLNWALRDVLGSHVDQKGSLVDEDKTRFDFSHPRAAAPEEIQAIERATVGQIQADQPVHSARIPLEQARRLNTLRAVFGEKYPDVVRVVAIGRPVEDLLARPDNPEWMALSVELCGGTHTARSGNVGAFCIVDESAVAKGIRRLTAVTGERALRCRRQGEALRESCAQFSRAGDEQLAGGVTELARRINEDELPHAARVELREILKTLQQRVKAHDKQEARAGQREVRAAAEALLAEAPDVRGTRLIVGRVPECKPEQVREAIDFLRAEASSAAIVLGGVAEDKVLLFASMTDDLVARGLQAGAVIRQVAPLVGGAGGGKPQLAQAGGRKPEGLDEALRQARQFLENELSSN
jgi:alanyl-tRNA synthetase